MASTVKNILARSRRLKNKKQPWLNHYQLLGEFIHQRKQEFTSVHTEGEFLTRQTFSGKGARAAKVSASSLLSRIWPQTKDRLRMAAPRRLPKTKVIKDYYQDATFELLDTLDDPRGGFSNASQEYMLDQVVFGTSGIEGDRDTDPDSGIRMVYRPWGVMHMAIDEGRNGVVNTTYISLMRTVAELVDEYGEDNVSKKVREFFTNHKLDEELEILIAIEPRDTKVIRAPTRGKLAMPFQSIHIEMDTKKILRRGGFEELKIKVGRMTKIMKEIYGRSFGMDALPDILQINAVWESISIATEKNLDPPLWMIDDGRLGGGELDTSPGALNVFNIAGRGGDQAPIGQLFTVGEILTAKDLLDRLEQAIAEHFAIDRLLDFNNTTRMTFGEAQIRDKNRNETLAGVLGRQKTEVFTPITELTINVILEDGHLGFPVEDEEGIAAYQERFQRDPLIIPPEVMKLITTGQSFYDIEYSTPAMALMNTDRVESITSTFEAALLMAPLAPDVGDNLDADEAIRLVADFKGAPSQIKRAVKKMENIRDERVAQAAEAAQAEQIRQGSEAMRNAGQSGLVPTVNQESE